MNLSSLQPRDADILDILYRRQLGWNLPQIHWEEGILLLDLAMGFQPMRPFFPLMRQEPCKWEVVRMCGILKPRSRNGLRLGERERGDIGVHDVQTHRTPAALRPQISEA